MKIINTGRIRHFNPRYVTTHDLSHAAGPMSALYREGGVEVSQSIFYNQFGLSKTSDEREGSQKTERLCYLLFLSCSDCYGWLRLRLRRTICLSKVKVQRSKSHNEKTTGEIFACMQPCQTNKKNICQEKRSVRKIRQKHA